MAVGKMSSPRDIHPLSLFEKTKAEGRPLYSKLPFRLLVQDYKVDLTYTPMILAHDETIKFIKIVEAAGVDYITIHGRLRNQRSSTPPNFEAIKMLRAQTTLPVLANGDVYSLEDALRITKETGVDGVMAARGLLENPALFAGFDKTPIEAVSQFIHYAVQSGMRHELVVHHLSEMMGGVTTKRERAGLAVCNDMVDVVDWLDSRCKLQRPLV
ncbi:tRNA-dihydrouridine synthase [Aureobasidium sp. EXF-10727]|nr:tRNA-dihydrouridine synthase [Aureobasidium sp. EXF-10727]